MARLRTCPWAGAEAAPLKADAEEGVDGVPHQCLVLAAGGASGGVGLSCPAGDGRKGRGSVEVVSQGRAHFSDQGGSRAGGSAGQRLAPRGEIFLRGLEPFFSP